MLTHKITEDHLTLPGGGLHTFSSNMVVSFFELYYCVYSVKKNDLIKQKLEITASHHSWRSISKLHCVKSVRIRKYSGPHFPAFGVYLRIQSECGKMRTRITPNMNTFYAVLFFKLSRLEKMFEITTSWVIAGAYIQS